MKRLKTWFAGCLLVLVLLPCAASAAGVELAVGVWNQTPKGDVSYKGTTAQDNLSIKNDLKYSDETRVSGRMRIETPLFFPNIYLMASPMRFKESGSKATAFNFGNVRIAANTPFTSELRLDHYDVGLFYGIPALKTATGGLLNVDLGVDGRIVDFKARVSGRDSFSGLSVTDSKSVVFALPMVHVGVQLKPFSWLAAEAEGRGITYGRNYYYDIIGRLKIKPFGPVFAAGGYRYETVKIDRDGVKAKADFGGPFGELGVEF
jgi:outer membrane protein